MYQRLSFTAWSVAFWLVITAFGAVTWTPCCAGGGPENVFLVVNSLSPDSRAIANYYTDLREIPDINVFELEWGGSRVAIKIDTFRQQILAPILAEMSERRLESQIDYIVYSSGFPYAVDFSADVRTALPREAGTLASLTGLTFFQGRVRARDSSYAFTFKNDRSNSYQSTRTRGFRSQYAWNKRGQQVQLDGESYYLSMMLGYTDGRGNSLEEVVQYLRRSALADCSRPSGTVYLMQNEAEVRSRTRHNAFPEVAKALAKLGVQADVVNGVLPSKKNDVLGAVIGRAQYSWEKSGSTILPGAICENLTSFGGVLKQSAKQTPLTECLRYGATASSGTVAEPFALQAKFPHPWVQVHYARGATVAESFYQSVAAPYQLLIVGDPLCRPWARSPTFIVDEISPGEKVTGTIRMTPQAAPGVAIREYQFFVNGRLRRITRPGDSFEIDTNGLANGWQDLRIVAIEESVIESQAQLLLPIDVANQDMKMEWALRPSVIYENEQVQLFVSCKNAVSIHLFHRRQPIGVIKGGMGQLTIDTSSLGSGPITLTAIGIGKGRGDKVYSKPIQFFVRPADEFSAVGQP
ncbi:MAG: TIGR03790 family protein [Pirellulaceae bacterium]|nr:TIGR03790 family protein [Pirellulaceae bacterium]